MTDDATPLSDASITADALSLVQAQRPVLSGLSWVGKLAFGWLLKVVEGYLVSWLIDLIVIALGGVTLVVIAEWIAARVQKVSPAVRSTFGLKVAATTDPVYRAELMPGFTGVYRVFVDLADSERGWFPSKEQAEAYARLLNSGIRLS